MVAVTACKRCWGSGEIPFTKERGGPVCTECGGYGYITPSNLKTRIACSLDYPSVYMDGPSPQSRKRAERIFEILEDVGIAPPEPQGRVFDGSKSKA